MLPVLSCKNNKTDDNSAETVKAIPPQSIDSINLRVNATPDSSHKLTDSITLVKKKNNTTSAKMKKNGGKGKATFHPYAYDTNAKMVKDQEGVYNHAEIMPAFPGGEKELAKYIEDHIEYPENALDNDIQGTVKLTFAVDEAGKIYAPKVISPKLGYGLEEESLRVIRDMPKWSPGRIKGQNVKTRFTLPITYQIN
ncbi:MAG: hypothetical protein NVS3B15_14170 [Sediminibacterium sp.]